MSTVRVREQDWPTKEELLKAQTRTWNHAFGCIKPLSLMVAVQLGIPDAIHSCGGHPVSLSDLASTVGIPEAKLPALCRLMGALSQFGFFVRDVVNKAAQAGSGAEEEDAYLPTAFSQVLVRDSPTTAASFLLHGTSQMLVTPWYSMAAWFRGEGPQATTGFEAAHGKTAWEWLGQAVEDSELFNRTMACDSRWVMSLVAREHPEVFQGLASLVDVGGGTGTAMKAIKEVFPEMRCTVLELPHVVAAAPAMEGVDFIEGDMFDHVPPADAVLLKWVLHAYDEEDCVRLLRRCREAIMPARDRGGKVIVVEMVMGVGDVGDGELAEAQHLFDLQMLVIPGGKERDEGQWRRIFSAAGFSSCKITPALGPRSIIEAYP